MATAIVANIELPPKRKEFGHLNRSSAANLRTLADVAALHTTRSHEHLRKGLNHSSSTSRLNPSHRPESSPHPSFSPEYFSADPSSPNLHSNHHRHRNVSTTFSPTHSYGVQPLTPNSQRASPTATLRDNDSDVIEIYTPASQAAMNMETTTMYPLDEFSTSKARVVSGRNGSAGGSRGAFRVGMGGLRGMPGKAVTNDDEEGVLEFVPDNNDDDDDESEEEDSYESTESSEGSSSALSWISWYCSLPGHEFFLEVPEDFIEDDFNLTGLNTAVVLYNEALDMILDLEPTTVHGQNQISLIESAAETLYGLIHQRYLLTRPALQIMAERLKDFAFGVCPRFGCSGMGTVPCGRSDQLGLDTVKMFCGRCCDIYHPRESKYQNLDGAFFGTTFPHMLFLTFPELIPPVTSPPRLTTSSSFRVSRSSHRSGEDDNESKDEFHDAEDDEDDEEGLEDEFERIPDYQVYVPTIFGFRVSERAKTGPRMQWMRWKEGLPGRNGFDREGGSWGTEGMGQES
ncbi:casein kinase 2 regulatory subunit [Phlyctochytrium planicorne]|nr:casein kinase 2 regulatory subunit [Phlyctochytrium planicorne]